MIDGETYMVLVATLGLFSWVPQIHRILQTRSTDDFSLWTTAILVWANGSFLWWSIQIDDTPLFVQQAITCVMLAIFTFLVLKFRKWNK